MAIVSFVSVSSCDEIADVDILYSIVGSLLPPEFGTVFFLVNMFDCSLSRCVSVHFGLLVSHLSCNWR